MTTFVRPVNPKHDVFQQPHPPARLKGMAAF